MHASKRAIAALCGTALALGAIPMLPQPLSLAAEAVVINEVCTKNTTVAAADGAFYDYVELYNPTTAAVRLNGFTLSDSANSYAIPDGTTLAGHGYLVIYCGLKEASGTLLGTTFGLSKDGETITLASASDTIETLIVPAMTDDVAYARTPDGADTFATLSRLSPGAANPTDALIGIQVPMPTFSKDSGFYNGTLSLTLSAAAGNTIYYTTDGSDPTTASTKYTAALTLSDPSNQPNVLANERDIADNYQPPTKPVDKAAIVRAIAVDSSGNCSAIATNSYFFDYTNADYATNMRVISLVTDPENLFDHETGIYVLGKVHEDWEKDPTADHTLQTYQQPANYTQSGRAWERPANITVFENGEKTFTQDVGIRIHGAATRSSAQKSFNLYARSDYGPTKLNYDFFGGTLVSPVDGKVIDSFDSLTLRNGGNDNESKLRDRLNQELVAGRNFGTLAQTECVVFIDGEFWGLYNIVEKISKDYVSDHYDVKADSVCVVKKDEMTDGSDQGFADYNALCNWALTTDYSAPSAYETFCKLCDPLSFADYMAAEIILGNQDFGSNNFACWKTETIKESNPYADGRWRFLMYDTEYGQGLYQFGGDNSDTDILYGLQENDAWLPTLFFGLMNHCDDFFCLFANTYMDLVNTAFVPESVLARLDTLSARYQKPMVATLERFPGGFGMFGQGGSAFTSNVSTIRNFYQKRAAKAPDLLADYLRFAEMQTLSPVSVTIANDDSKGIVTVNSTPLSCPQGTWTGQYWYEVPITLTANALPGAQFKSWETAGSVVLYGESDYADESASFLLVTAQLPLQITATYEAAQKGNGDGNGDGKTDAKDVQLLLQWLTCASKSLTAAQAAALDMDGSGILTAIDLSLLKKAC